MRRHFFFNIYFINKLLNPSITLSYFTPISKQMKFFTKSMFHDRRLIHTKISNIQHFKDICDDTTFNNVCMAWKNTINSKQKRGKE